MDKIKVIITGATGMVGEGVLLECLQNKMVTEVLIVNRRHYELQHIKLKELIVPDFFRISDLAEQLSGYDACFYCAGISSIGMKEEEYARITYDTTLHFANVLSEVNPNMVFNYVTGRLTDSSEKGRSMWARVKGKTENALMKLPFRGQYNFRPGLMKPFKQQKNVKSHLKPIIYLFSTVFRSGTLTMEEVGKAMINAVIQGYPKKTLEVEDIKKLSGYSDTH